MIAGAILALSLWPIPLPFVHQKPAGPPPAPVVLPSPAEMDSIAASAVAYVKLENESVGMPGLTGDVKTCYGALPSKPSPSKAAYCIMLDTAASTIAYAGGEHFTPDYFKDEERARRELKVEERVTIPDQRRDFVQEMDEAERQAGDPS